MKEKILQILSEEEGYVSGQEICGRLGVSRTAVWKWLKKLREEGYEIESQTRKGYRLLGRPDILSAEEIRRFLPEGILPGRLEVFPVTDSTNEEAKRAYAAGFPDRSLFVADQQTAGKGRRGRNWNSPRGKDVFFSFLLRPDIPPECASMLTLIAALAGVRALSKQAEADYRIKWPNDIVLGGRKICGILTEMGADMDRIHYVVPGIGFNLNRTEFPEEIRSFAGSVYLETGQKICRSRLVADYVVEFMRRYEVFLKAPDLSSFMEEYNACLINAGQEVCLIRRGEKIRRTALGINERGELLVRDREGQIETVFSGEVSVRGLYGYV